MFDLVLAEAAEVTVTNDTAAGQWQRIYERIRTEIHDREFPAVTHDGIRYVFFTGWHYNNQGVAYNPETNTFGRGMAAFKPIGQHWYVWAMTDHLWKGPQQYEGTNRPSAEQSAPANGSQPFSPVTNREPSAAGSRR